MWSVRALLVPTVLGVQQRALNFGPSLRIPNALMFIMPSTKNKFTIDLYFHFSHTIRDEPACCDTPGMGFIRYLSCHLRGRTASLQCKQSLSQSILHFPQGHACGVRRFDILVRNKTVKLESRSQHCQGSECGIDRR